MGKVIIAHASSDATDLYIRIKEQLERESQEKIIVTDQLQPMPNSWEAAVVLFVISQDALQDINLSNYAQDVIKQQLPLLPVVENLSTYDFRSIPSSLKVLSDRNAVGIEPVDGATLEETVKGYLGFESFAKSKKVFISYRRSDAKSQANLVYEYLWNHKFQVFLDTHQIEGAAVVQEEIMQDIRDKDFVLFFDSPNVLTSEWVIEEIKTALLQRIPVCSVRFEDNSFLKLVSDMPSVKWDIKDVNILEKIRMMVSRAIASRSSLDTRIKRTLRQSANLKSISLKELDKRQLLLFRNQTKVVFEYEDAPISLERLHRLHTNYCNQSPCEGAIFICGDQPILELTKDAITWASGSKPLQVAALVELYKTLDLLFP
ncbi:MAG: toll/interleukin-1 receptor domain-containing protein [Blastocatellia bacterium]